MNKENTMKLVRRFPVLYQDFYSDMRETCMCWGFSHGDGWFDIIWQLSLAIEEELGYSWLQERWFLFAKKWSRKWNNLIYKLSPVRERKFHFEGSGKTGDPIHREVHHILVPGLRHPDDHLRFELHDYGAQGDMAVRRVIRRGLVAV